MKRFLTFAAILILASTAFAGYPADYHGDQLPDGCIEVEAWITEFHDMNPWGSPDPTGMHFLFGTLCVEPGSDVAVLDLTQFAYRYCREAPWGAPGDQLVCHARYLGEWRWSRHVLARDNGVYISGIWSEDNDGQAIYHFDALTYDAETNTARWVQGTFSLSSMWFEDDDRYTRTTWTVQPRQAEALMRRVTARMVQ
jgi:hypothetical protein